MNPHVRKLFAVSASMALVAGLASCGGDDDDDDTGTVTPPPAVSVPEGASLDLAILATTDLHANVLGYDYYKLAEDKSYGVDRTATLIANARKQYANTLLFDNGDTIQGTALSDYQALVSPVQCSDMIAIYKQMKLLAYDAGTMGNHEFNYGLPFLSQITNVDFGLAGIGKGTAQTNPAGAKDCAAPGFPFVSANVVSAASKQPIFKPWVLLNKTFKATDASGKSIDVPLKVGVIGFAPPPILQWDKANLEGHVEVTGWKETAQRFVPEMKAAGADLIVALAHGGIDMKTAYSPSMENGAGYLSQVPGIDALITGHQHLLFPDTSATSQFRGQPGIDLEKGLINGVPAVQAGQWGNNLGQISLKLSYDKGWKVQKDATSVQRISTRLTAQNGATPATYVASDTAVQQLVQAEHTATIAYVKTPIGQSQFDMATYYALTGDVSALQIVNMAQIDYLTDYITKNNPSYGNLPILSAAAPFKGGRNGPGDFTFVKQGNVAINNAADLYLYPNTLQVVRVNGDIVRQWLEKTAEQFKQIDPSLVAPQDLVDTSFPTFNFDVLYAAGNALKYQIDVSQPKGARITGLTYQGAPLDPAAQFLVVTNNYRASGGGDFPVLAGGKGDIVLQAPDASRDVLISYIKKNPTLDLATFGLDRSWRFKQLGALAGPVVFWSVPGTLPMAVAHGVTNVSVYDPTPDATTQLSRYAVDLSQ
ncbi:2',3'-cyclic-nucleotide 2'-phosphodiesterase/3'-nucleotidase [Achromobacter pestifer]|uniref:2',3'-cyclic-nucleotide 2'-phosphodiesterase/3'-nucleotidase n=2 Tax=Achromobacter pestifer TaxID=1353889 RepID=A0A6S6YT27_9BURK|nr:5'-nucleotidase C-terminal domain-containing protein [Achromobacter pestifer]CAB3642202.1 2',3'-cyclic-nucleotide 2'-phosphodiesterase/3'-nucleotidase [Achromobacter pestifer]